MGPNDPLEDGGIKIEFRIQEPESRRNEKRSLDHLHSNWLQDINYWLVALPVLPVPRMPALSDST